MPLITRLSRSRSSAALRAASASASASAAAGRIYGPALRHGAASLSRTAPPALFPTRPRERSPRVPPPARSRGPRAGWLRTASPMPASARDRASALQVVLGVAGCGRHGQLERAAQGVRVHHRRRWHLWPAVAPARVASVVAAAPARTRSRRQPARRCGRLLRLRAAGTFRRSRASSIRRRRVRRGRPPTRSCGCGRRSRPDASERGLVGRSSMRPRCARAAAEIGPCERCARPRRTSHLRVV